MLLLCLQLPTLLHIPSNLSWQREVSNLLHKQAIHLRIPLLQLRGELSSVPALAAWRAAEPENKYNLPSFSAYPQAYATAAGEYLMMLPQMLESLYASSGVDGEQQPGIDADWLDKVCCIS